MISPAFTIRVVREKSSALGEILANGPAFERFAIEIREDVSGRYVEHSSLNAIRLQQSLQVQRCGTLVTRRVRSVDSYQFLQQLNCFGANVGPVDLGGRTGRDYEQQEHSKKGKTNHIGPRGVG